MYSVHCTRALQPPDFAWKASGVERRGTAEPRCKKMARTTHLFAQAPDETYASGKSFTFPQFHISRPLKFLSAMITSSQVKTVSRLQSHVIYIT